MPYTLTRRTFLDVVWNRIGIVEFRPTPYEGLVYPLSKRLDRLGRLQVCLTINSENPLEAQAETLVHESIHVDRNVWEKNRNISSLLSEFEEKRAKEEDLTNIASKAFFEEHKQLALRALNHLKLRARCHIS